MSKTLGEALGHIFGAEPKAELKKKIHTFSDKEWERRKKARKRAKEQRKIQRQKRS